MRSGSASLQPKAGQNPEPMSADITYTRSYFDLQLRFAARVAALSRMPLARVLLDYTNLYVRFGIGRAFDATQPVWRDFLAGVEREADLLDWTCEFYRTRLPDAGPPAVVASCGCFSYARLGDDRIRLHFQNAEEAGRSPLGAERREHRLADLRALFAAVRQREPRPPRVVGASWLYNLPAYRRLFPEAYLATAVETPPRFRNMPMWGQFLDRHGEVRQAVAEPFLRRVSGQVSVEGLARCFPFQVLALEAPASVFDAFYQL
jgi:hypothetical protein